MSARGSLQRGSTGERMRSIGELVAKHCATCPYPPRSLKARLWWAERAARGRETVSRGTGAVSRPEERGRGRGRARAGDRGEWSRQEVALLRRALAEEIQLARLTLLLPRRSERAIYLKLHRLRREGVL